VGQVKRRLADQLLIFSGNANRALVTQFRNEEIRVRIEQNVRGADVFVVQSLCGPVHEHIMELLLLIDALRRASAERVTAVIPYYAYARQEKKTAGREPISARLLANLITVAGANRVITVDLHAAAIEGFFDIPVDHLRASPFLARATLERLKRDGIGEEELVVVSPDSGGVARANEFRARTGGRLAIIAKHRPRPDVAEVLEMVGDVRGKSAVIVDDMISTGGTLIEAADALLERGAREVYACATHGIFAGSAAPLIQQSVIREVIVTNTIPLPNGARYPKIQQVTIAPLLAETIRRVHLNLSVSSLFT